MFGFFKSKEVKNVLAEINTIEAEEGAEGLFHIKEQVLHEISGRRNAEKTKLSIIKDGMKVRDLAFLIILNVLSRELTSGRFHIYRGVLSNIGHELLRLWDYSVQQQRLSGYYTDEDVENDEKWIRAEIKQAG